MRRIASHGRNQVAYRIFPGSPDDDQQMRNYMAARGLFIEGLERLHHQRGLTADQHQYLDALPASDDQRQRFHRLEDQSNQTWQLAMDKQAYLRRDRNDPGPFSVTDLGQQLQALATEWERFKATLPNAQESESVCPTQSQE